MVCHYTKFLLRTNTLIIALMCVFFTGGTVVDSKLPL
jgi:hypothetical protein